MSFVPFRENPTPVVVLDGDVLFTRSVVVSAPHFSRIAATLAKAQLPDADWNRFSQLVARRHDKLVSLIGSNDEWDWYGNASLLVVGTKR